MEKKSTLRDTLKSQDTEEWIDLVFYRPIGYLWALIFQKMNVSPNAVTVLSILLGIAAGVMFYFTNTGLNIAGMFLLIWANTYDSADGQLARMSGNFSRIGRILDGIAGNCWFVSIYAAICFRLMPEWGFYIWLLAAVTGFFHGKQTATADYIRNFHLLFIKSKNESELDDSVQLSEQAQLLTWKNNFIEKLFMIFYVPYTRDQERWTPQLQLLRKTLADRFGENEYPDDFKQAFRMESKPMMKYTNILSFNTRVMALFISLFAGRPWLYFLFELSVMNGVQFYVRYKYEAICKRFILRLQSGK